MKHAELVVANTAEAFLELLRRYGHAQRDRLIHEEHVLGDRAILWGGANKIVLSSLPIMHIGHLEAYLGYEKVKNFFPRTPSASLSEDLLYDKVLFSLIVSSLVGYDSVRLLSYVASNGLIDLIAAFDSAGLHLTLVETPITSAGGDVARIFDTKSGFRRLFYEWNSEQHGLAMPPGVICQTPREAALETVRRLENGIACLCKADRGESGIGLLWFKEPYNVSAEQVELMLMQDPAFGSDPIVVEEIVAPPRDLPPITRSPSIEAYVDPVGDVQVTYASVQLFEGGGHFSGVLIDRLSIPEGIMRQMVDAAQFLGHNLAGKGYRGYFDVDFVVGEDHQAYLVEGNPRRTGGTHAHDLAVFLFGPNYLDEHVVLTRSTHVASELRTWDEIVSTCDDLMFRRGEREVGVVPTVTSTLASGSLSYAILERTGQAALALEKLFVDTIKPKNRFLS